jgi:hypothetical protein
MNNQLPPEVMAMKDINFSGNIIPFNWYNHLRYDSGKTNLNAIIILSEIVYWYRPSEVRDEETGQLLGYKKKFKADKLQRSHQSFSDQFGLTKKQVRDALGFLEDNGLITKELRTIATQGVTLSNVLFIGIVPAKIKAITLQVTPMTFKSHPPNIEVIPSAPASQTYTKTPTRISTENWGENPPTPPPDSFTDLFPEQVPQPNGPTKSNPPEINSEINHEVDLWFANAATTDEPEDAALRQIEGVWQKKRIAHDTKLAMAAYFLSMQKHNQNLEIPRDKTTQGKWAAGVKDHLDNYSLADLKRLYPLAIKHAQDRGWDIYSPQSLTSALAKVSVQQQTATPAKNYKDDPQYKAFSF